MIREQTSVKLLKSQAFQLTLHPPRDFTQTYDACCRATTTEAFSSQNDIPQATFAHTYSFSIVLSSSYKKCILRRQ